jgi:UDP-N-acetylglucosamine 2-epimerase (non-hydrolysing)
MTENQSTQKTVVVAIGTRPEATKMGPVIQALRQPTLAKGQINTVVLSTGQHREQLQAGLDIFGLTPDHDLALMVSRQTLPDLAGRMIPAAADFLRQCNANYVLVHGDTLTTFCVAWAAFLLGIPVGHVEAGLRSNNMREPFPEEANRRLTDILTDLALAPTTGAQDNLLREGILPGQILVTGQTQVDAVRYAAERGQLPEMVPTSGRVVTITMHRRENWPLLGALAQMLADIAQAHPDVTFVYPVHLNPVVREAVWPILGVLANVRLLEPLEYGAMAALMQRSELLITDSGGLQEEGASLGVPVVVLRNVTERPEGLAAGVLRLAGTDPAHAFAIVDQLLASEAERAQMSGKANPYGDGLAAGRVAAAVAWRLGLGDKPLAWQ